MWSGKISGFELFVVELFELCYFCVGGMCNVVDSGGCGSVVVYVWWIIVLICL